jgi:chaperone required for assembly of F1-ATPase
MQRFWNEARAAAGEGGGFAILLDGRPMRLPGGAALSVAGAPLAEAIAAEWQQAGGAKGGRMRPEEVPLTRLVGTATERIAPDPAGTITALARYAEAELLCYRAEHGKLAARQAEAWDPWLRWAAQGLDAPLRITTGIMPVAQPPHALAALQAAIARHPPLELAALGVAVPALGSLVLGLALAQGHLAPAEAHRLATIDEAFQNEVWGSDAEALRRRESAAADVALAARLVALARA